MFPKALQAASAFHITKVEAALPFEVTIGMIFIGTYVGGRIQDRRGPRIVAWSIGGVVGPLLAARLIGEAKNYMTAYTVIGVIALLSLVLPFVTRIPRRRQSVAEGYLGEASATS